MEIFPETPGNGPPERLPMGMRDVAWTAVTLILLGTVFPGATEASGFLFAQAL